MTRDWILALADLPDRIRSKIVVAESGCWEWTAAQNRGGYGAVWDDGRVRRAHRVVYAILVGAIPDGLTLDHLCRNPPCVNPAHLEPVTNRENCLRGEGVSAVAARKTHCPSGHPYSGDNLRVYSGIRYCHECTAQRTRERNADPAARARASAYERERAMLRALDPEWRARRAAHNRAYRARRRAAADEREDQQ